MEMVRILIADDHPLFREGMTTVLSAAGDLEVVGHARTGEEAVTRAAELQPDVILMDIQMPGIHGIEATRRILAQQPGMKVLIVTMFQDDASVFTAMRAGARGYVLKDAEKEDLLRAIRAVSRGEAIFSPGIAARITDFFTMARPAVPQESFPALSSREREVLHLMAQGSSNAEVARLLSLTGKTVANYVSTILAKLQVADRAEAVLRARQSGLGPG